MDRLAQFYAVVPPAMHACNCIGPQGGAPLCPCMMRGVIERDGRWVQVEVDLGPVRTVNAHPFR